MAPIASAASVIASTWWRSDRACAHEAAQHERRGDGAACQRGERRSPRRAAGRSRRFAADETSHDTAGHGSNRYPTPHAVVIQRGFLGSASSFWRSRPTCTVTVAESWYSGAESQTWASSWRRENTCRG